MFRIFVDSDCDITKKMADEYGAGFISMPYFEGEKEVYPYIDFETFDAHEYYNTLRKGLIPTTAALNPATYVKFFEPYFEAGDEMLYIHFSAAMTNTFEALEAAVKELSAKYPAAKFVHFDTMSMTVGAYPIVKEMLNLYKEGKSLEEIVSYGEKERQHFACYFFADDLKFFARSGRVSGFAGFMGGIIGIKPIISINENGIMGSVGKATGRGAAIAKLVKYVEDLGEDIKNHVLVIGHTDAPLLVKKVSDMLKAQFGEDLQIEKIAVNPTAGAHCGPDAVGIAFHAKHR